MMPIVSRAQMHVSDVRVNLRGGNVAVAQERLHRTRISSVLQQVSRKTMPQRVRRNVLDPRALRMALDHGPREMPRERFPDRKSTRLNSSHSQISYAVFCLKNNNA